MTSCHNLQGNFNLNRKSIALVGNPNSGKSVIFYKLTGVYNIVSNYPGTTLDILQGRYHEWQIIDTPGVYGLSMLNIEEKITNDIALKVNFVINVVNALHLERELFLTLELIDMGFHVIVVLNFMDELQKQQINIDFNRLALLLGVKVIPTVAIKDMGLYNIKSAITKSNFSKKDRVIDHKDILNKYGLNGNDSLEGLYQKRRDKVDLIVNEVIKNDLKKEVFKNKLGSFLVHPFFGFIFMISVLYLSYQIIGVFVAQYIVNFTEKTMMQGYYTPFIQRIFAMVTLPDWLNYTLVGEFGILTMSINYIIGLLLPLVISFYILLSIFEDSGYLPRLAFLIDKWLNKVGLNGKAIIPLILGFGCVTMATLTTKMLDTKKEKTIASALLNFTIPCSAQLAVITALMATAGGYVAMAYTSIIFVCFVILGTILEKTLPGESSQLIFNLPLLQMPRIDNIIRKTIIRTTYFIKEAGIWFIFGAFIISIFKFTGLIDVLKNLISPIVVNWMGLPKEAAIGYIMGIVRRDFGAAGFYTLSLTSIQLLVALVSITLFVPCIAAILVLYKEQGPKIATGIWVGTIITAFIIGGLISKLWGFINGINM